MEFTRNYSLLKQSTSIFKGSIGYLDNYLCKDKITKTLAFSKYI